MATVTGSGGMQNGGYFKYTWETLTTTNDNGNGVISTRFPDKSVQVKGTFGVGGDLHIEGSNDGGTTWARLRDPQGNLISITAAGIVGILENPELIRPKVNAGDGATDLDAVLIARDND